ncbi:hypothetical protein B0E43_04805 [Algoriphagus sp. A40]|nr:hypothetical protein B0E43_04805 [Algoriphagus sp. A40]
MEAAATFLLLFIIYFLGCLAIVQLAIRPMKRLVNDSSGNSKHWETNYSKILLVSLLLTLITTTIAFIAFP